jgi:tellurite resistance protein TehA-like permease
MSAPRTTNLAEITASQLLPAAATIVAAGAGSKIAAEVPDPQRALGTLVACYVLWGMGMPLALLILAMYYQRLAVHKLPSREALVSCFLPLGPLGFGGYGYVSRFPTSLY